MEDKAQHPFFNSPEGKQLLQALQSMPQERRAQLEQMAQNMSREQLDRMAEQQQKENPQQAALIAQLKTMLGG